MNMITSATSANPLLTQTEPRLQTKSKPAPFDSMRLKTEGIMHKVNENIVNFGATILGEGNIKRWQEKGLTIESQAYEEAYKQMNAGFKSLAGKAGSVAINQYEIVRTRQDVPTWFIKEQQQITDTYPDPVVREQFNNRALFVAQESPTPNKAKLAAMYGHI